MAKRIIDLTEVSGIDLSGYFAEIDKSGLSESVRIDLKNMLRGLIDSSGNVVARGVAGSLEVDSIKRSTFSAEGKVLYPIIAGSERVYTSLESLGLTGGPAGTATIGDIQNALSENECLFAFLTRNGNPSLNLPETGTLLVDKGSRILLYSDAWEEHGAIYSMEPDSPTKWQLNGSLLIGSTYRSGGSWVNKYKLRQYTTTWNGLLNRLEITHNLNAMNYVATINVLESVVPKKFTYIPDANTLYIYIEDVSDVENLRVNFKIETLGNLITP